MSSNFLAVQFEFTHAIGPHAGRYVVAHPSSVDDSGAALRKADPSRRERLTGVTMEAGSADVLAISILGAPAGGRPRLRRRAREDDLDAGSAEVPLLLATFIRGTEPLEPAEADRRLVTITADEDSQQEWVTEGLAVINRAIRAYRIGARDPYVIEVSQRDARAVRIGYGTTEGLPEGTFRRAALLPPPLGVKASREERLVPSETTADALAGRITLVEGEDVLLRAYLDLDLGRDRAAAVQVRGAIKLLRSEPGDELGLDFDELVRRAAAADAEAVEAIADELGRALESWRYARVAR